MFKGLALWLIWLWNSGHDPEAGSADLRTQNESIKTSLKV